MPLENAGQVWKMGTSTIGLVTARHEGGVNVMSAEWSYFVNKDPLMASVVLSPRSKTRELIADSGEFSLTLCSEEQAELADFAGSFSLSETDKTTSELVSFGDPRTTSTPWVEGGVVAMECVLEQTVPFPVHTMFVGEVVAVHLPETDRRPLVKHGPVHVLGAPVTRTVVVVAANITPEGTLRVAATGPAASGPDRWRLSALAPDGTRVNLGEHPSAEYGDFLVELPPPDGLSSGSQILVEREGAKPGLARILHHTS